MEVTASESKPWRGESPGGYRVSELLNCGVGTTDSQGDEGPEAESQASRTGNGEVRRR